MCRVFAVEDDGFLAHDEVVVEEALCELFLVIEVDSTIDMAALIFVFEATINNGILPQSLNVFAQEHIYTCFFGNPWKAIQVFRIFEIGELEFVFVISCQGIL